MKRWLHAIASGRFPAREWAPPPPAARVFQELERNQRLPPADLADLNRKKRADLLRHAFEHVPFYRERFTAAGLAGRDLASPDAWEAVPLLTRQDVVTRFEELRDPSRPPDQGLLVATGGTTGTPVKVLHDKAYPAAALHWRILRWWGLRPDAPRGRVGRRSDEERAEQGKAGKPGEPRLAVTTLDGERMDRFVADWNRARPDLLAGYVGGIHRVACHVLDRGLRVHRPLAVQTTTAPLTAGVRRQIEEAFGAPVYDQYGSCEVYWLAAECRRHDGLHVFSDARHVEAVDDDGRLLPPGAQGRLVVTDLENRLFPLIRYVNGNRGALRERPCPCGIGLPLMEPVRGRITDSIRLPGGGVIDGVYFTTLFDACPDAVRGFQVRQGQDFAIDLLVIPNPACPDADAAIERVRRELLDKTRGAVPLAVVRTQAIPSARGKTQYVVSDAK